ncbi:hypothetical protein [uncultured Alistipes sp.]|jgi:lipoprotein|uniref:hypothetical protein n=1 Tax=uncultured Alistipes sp. TaxID=538949 RepID=UPI0025DE4011|nr:hypothetical protein [uncultured Alistipes sp.]
MKKMIRFGIILSTICLVMTACKDGDTIYKYEGIDFPSVSIELAKNPSSDEVQALFKPEEGAVRVVYAIGSAEDREHFLAGNMTGAEVSMGSEEFTRTFSSLAGGRQYVIYAVAYNSDDIPGGIASLTVTTALAGSFGITLQYVSDKGAGIHMVSDPSLYYAYVYHLGKESDRQDVLDRNIGLAKIEIDSFTANYFDLIPSSDYIFFVLALNRYGESELFELPVTTLAEDAVTAVTLTTGGDSYFVDMTFEPNSLTGKTLMAVTDNYNAIQGLIDAAGGDVFATMERWWHNAVKPVTHIDSSDEGTLRTTFQNLRHAPGAKYVVYALSYDKGGNPANIQIIDFETPLDETATEATADIEMIVNTLSRIEFSITPSANTYAVYYNIIDADDIDRMYPNRHENPTDIFNRYLQYSYIYTGPSAEPFTLFDTDGLQPGRRAYLLIMLANQNGRQGLGRLIEYEFTLPNS